MSKTITLNYLTLRNITPPRERARNAALDRSRAKKSEQRWLFSGVCDATAVLGIPTDSNVRDAIQKNTKLLKEIKSSIAEFPDDFVFKNGGITILAQSVVVDDRKREVVIKGASIINGAQTQACIEWWGEDEHDEQMPEVKFEILVLGGDTDLEREVSVTRNSVHKVSITSIMGFKGELDDLVRGFDSDVFALKETDEGADPLKLLQVIELLNVDWPNPATTYRMKIGALSRYGRKGPAERKRLHALAFSAWELYEDLRNDIGEAFKNKRLHESTKSVKRDKKGKLVYVSDALVFPIIYAHRERLVGTKLHRLLPEHEALLVDACVDHFKSTARSNIHVMGSTVAAYKVLRTALKFLAVDSSKRRRRASARV